MSGLYQSTAAVVCGMMLWACNTPSQQQAAGQPTTNSSVDSVAVTHRTYPTPTGTIRVDYRSASEISVLRTAGKDTLRIALQGDFQPDGVIGCDSCLLVQNRGKSQQTGGYAVNDSLFLLTVAGTSWRALLYGIDLKTGAVLETQGGLPNDHLETYLDAFLYDVPSQQLIASNSLGDTEETATPQPLTLNRYVIKDNAFVWQGQKKHPAPANLRRNSATMWRLLQDLTSTR